MSNIPENDEQLYVRYLNAFAKAASGTPLGKDDITDKVRGSPINQATAAALGTLDGATRSEPAKQSEFARKLREMVAS